MKVRILRGIEWDGLPRKEGDVLDLKEWDANWLISRGKAVLAEETAVVDNYSRPIENRAVALDNSAQPQLTKRTVKKKVQSL